MGIIADLHLHSRFSRATSKQISIENLEKYARVKGLNLLGTGDFQHPEWNKELKENLSEDEFGILRTKNGFPFIWSTELSLIYTQGGKGRKIHYVILAPNKEIVDQIIEFLGKRGRLDYDGRPIFGFSSIELVENLMNISKDIEIIPAHIWTPWFSLFGSNSGFNSVEECFQEKSKYIHALETGMSSDPKMNRRLSILDKFNLVSFSDSHSHWPWRIGREATVFDIDKENLTYKGIINAIRTGKGIEKTIETDPCYGKYHFDGHRNCNLRLSPKETKKYGGICPVCGKAITKGVLYRVEQLADRKEGEEIKKEDFIHITPLSELIGFSYGINQPYSKKVWEVFNLLISKFGNEYTVLLESPYDKIKDLTNERLAKIIQLTRENKLKIIPGYDGTYGKIILDSEEEAVKRDVKEETTENVVKKPESTRHMPKQKRLDMFWD